MNEFREENRRNMVVTITRDKFDAEVGNIRKDVSDMITWRASVTGANSRANLLSIIAIILALIVALVDTLLKFYKP